MPAAVDQLYALVVHTPAKTRLSQQAALVPWISDAQRSRISTAAALVVYASQPNNLPRSAQESALVVWGSTPPGAENRTRAWTFVMDGHLFYVLDLGQEGTFLYDMDTGQWAQFRTQGYLGWNMRAGTVWQEPNRIVAGDTLYGMVWEMSPDDLLDEEFRTVEHIVTGGVMTRSRRYLSVESLRIAGSVGAIQDDLDGINTELRFSDNAGASWSEPYIVAIDQADYDAELAYRSLGSFMAPGRVFEFRDQGGMFRIDGADLFIEDFDDDSEAG